MDFKIKRLPGDLKKKRPPGNQAWASRGGTNPSHRQRESKKEGKEEPGKGQSSLGKNKRPKRQGCQKWGKRGGKKRSLKAGVTEEGVAEKARSLCMGGWASAFKKKGSGGRTKGQTRDDSEKGNKGGDRGGQ